MLRRIAEGWDGLAIASAIAAQVDGRCTRTRRSGNRGCDKNKRKVRWLWAEIGGGGGTFFFFWVQCASRTARGAGQKVVWRVP